MLPGRPETFCSGPIRYQRPGPGLPGRGRDLDFREEAMEKAINAEVKLKLQSSSSTCNMDSKCSRKNKPIEKEEKDSGGKKKFTNSAPADISIGKQTSSTQKASSSHLKKNHRGDLWRKRGRGQDLSATGVNAPPKKEEDLSQIKCFHCRKKGHYANWCL